MDYEAIFRKYKQQSLFGRYITNAHIEPLLKELEKYFPVTTAGHSVEGRTVYKVEAGSGSTKVFIWSQMHGNEATTTKAIFDFLKFLSSDEPFASVLKRQFTFCILPILNPDGAQSYTRENANKTDLNRDSVNLSQPESRILRETFNSFAPHFCYNMHDQRSIFGAGTTGKPATVSFLAPSFNNERDINPNRQAAINLIAAMNTTLQHYIPGQVGRFDDSFNINCIGDMFQSLGVPTVLFEAGHYGQDYEREESRKFIFIALLSGFNAIYENVIVVNGSDDYFRIPQNKINFYDMICKNVKINYENKQKITNFASHYNEVLFENSVIFEAFISEIGDLAEYYAHAEYDCGNALFHGEDGDVLPIKGKKANFSIGTGRKFVNGKEIR